MRSMTGFGRSLIRTKAGPVRIEVKTTNHRYLEFSTRLPYFFQSYEEQIRKIAQGKIKRGKVHMTVNTPELLIRKNHLVVDERLAKEYSRVFARLGRVLGLKEKISLQQVAQMPEVVTSTISATDHEKAWKVVKRGLVRALQVLDDSRKREGLHLQKDISHRVTKIERCVARIKKKAPTSVIGYEKSTDITEEIVRLGSHLKSFESTLKKGGEVGRKIDFLSQEIMRETNTTGAKCNNVAIANQVIEIKSELEKIREQAQNLE